MRNTIGLRKALAVAIPAGIAAIIGQRFLQPSLERKLKVR